MDLDEFNKLVKAIYSAGSTPEQWNDVLRQLAARFSGGGAALHINGLGGVGCNFGASYNLSPEAAVEYEQHYHTINPLNAALVRVEAGLVIPDHALKPRAEMRRTEFHNDYCRKHDIEGSLTLILDKNKHSMSCLGVLRGVNSTEFEPHEVSTFQLLAPHLIRSIELHKQLASAQMSRNAGLAALEHLETAVFLLRDNSFLAHCNTVGERLLQAQDGLTIRNGRIRATNLKAARELDRLIHEAATLTTGCGGVMKLPRPTEQPPLAARVLPVVGKEDFFLAPRIRAALFVSGPHQSFQSGAEQVAKMFALTAAETRLVTALVEGNSLTEAADLMQITKGTARKHLAHIMSKTGVHRQAELISLILTTRLPLR